MAKAKSLRYIVTGPGISESPSYADIGPAISRTLTAAIEYSKKKIEATFYARDSITDKVLGYSESHKDGTVTTRRNK